MRTEPFSDADSGSADCNLRTSTVTQLDGFAALGRRWAELLGRAVDPNTFLSHEWLHTWWTAYRPDAELRIVLVERNGALLGIAPMMIERRRRAGIPFRILRFVGDGTYETDHMNFLVDRDSREAVMANLLGVIGQLPWDAAHFNQMPEQSANTKQLLDYAGLQRWRLNVESTPCPVRTMPASFDTLLSTLPPRFRTSLRSSRKKLSGKHKVEFGLHRDDEFEEALDALFRNHASRWQAKGQQGVFEDEKKRRFYERLTPLLQRRGWLRFYYLKLDGRIVAQEYCFEHQGTVFLLQEGFDHEFARDNVGNTLRGMIFEHLISSGMRAYDFLAGTSRHKASWSDAMPNDLRIMVARRDARGWLYFEPPKLLARAKRRFRRSRNLERAGTEEREDTA